MNPVRNFLRSVVTMSLALNLPALGAAEPTSRAPWIPDRGDGTYRNPVLFADYSDPDVVRVGEDFYLTASSFNAAPGLPILHSKDLVNWTLINHVFTAQRPLERFSQPRHGEGVWAPAIRHHDGKFWIFYPDPDFGLYVTTATDAAGTWTAPLLIKAGKGLIDPCPFWDDDGQLYLVHGWAKSRAGIANLLTLHRLAPNGTRVLDSGTTIIDGAKLPGWNTIEGPKLYKRNGYYYIFAPAGGVSTGYQAVFRSRNIYGPYDSRIVLDQGRTAVNGPHQGAWVDTSTGEDWFLHFQDRGAFGRVVHLQPMKWLDDNWPVIGSDPDGDSKGEPVLAHKKPNVGREWPIAAPQTSDEFNQPTLGLQWQWNANPRPEWASLAAQNGVLRLVCVSAPAKENLYNAANLLLQKFPAPAFTVTTALQLSGSKNDASAGLIVLGTDYAWIGLRRLAGRLSVVQREYRGANQTGASEKEISAIEAPRGPIYFRVSVAADAVCRFAYSSDNHVFTPLGSTFTATPGRWVGAKVGLFATTSVEGKDAFVDCDWFRFSSEP